MTTIKTYIMREMTPILHPRLRSQLATIRNTLIQLKGCLPRTKATALPFQGPNNMRACDSLYERCLLEVLVVVVMGVVMNRLGTQVLHRYQRKRHDMQLSVAERTCKSLSTNDAFWRRWWR